MELELNTPQDFINLILMKVKTPQSASSLIELFNSSRYMDQFSDETTSEEEGWLAYNVRDIFGNAANDVTVSLDYFRNFVSYLSVTVIIADNWLHHNRDVLTEEFKNLFTSLLIQGGMKSTPDNSFEEVIKEYISQNTAGDFDANCLYGFGSSLKITTQDDPEKKISDCRIDVYPKMFKYEKSAWIHEGYSIDNAIKLNVSNTFEAIDKEEALIGFFYGRRHIDYNFTQTTLKKPNATYDQLDITYHINGMNKKATMYFDISSFYKR